MKIKTYLIFLLFIPLILFCFSKTDNKYISRTIMEQSNYSFININYPEFKSILLNKKITSLVNAEIIYFKNELEKIINLNKLNALDIKYELKKCKDVYSVHFIVSRLLNSDNYESFDWEYFFDIKKEEEVLNFTCNSKSKPIKKDNKVPNNNINPTIYTDKQLVLLTFDVGPSGKITEKLLNGLKERGVHVTFFILGNKAKEYPEIIKRAYKEGHTVGSHAYDHKILTAMKEEDVLEEIEETNEIIKDIIGVSPKFLRPPYGIYNNDLLEKIDMSFIIWNVDTKDWRRQSSDRIKNKIIKGANDGNIILLHDVYDWTIEGTLKAIDVLMNNGYAFVSLEEFILLRQYKIEKNKVYFSLQ